MSDQTITGTSGNNNLSGGSGDDYIDGGAGNDRLSGGAGSDTLDGGSGSDTLNGGSGSDTLAYTVEENYGARDVYTGGSGIDTVLINFTLAEWLSPSVQTQITQYLQKLAQVTNPVNGEVSNGSSSDFTFTFTSGSGSAVLTVQMIEKLRVTVDGVELDPRNDLVVANEDSAGATEGGAVIGGNVLGNDSVADLVASFQWTGAAPAGLTLGANGAWSFDPTNDAYDHLPAGQTAQVAVGYTVTDANGDTGSATLTITVTGSNDRPVAQAAVAAVNEDATTSGNVTATDADAGETATLSYALVDPAPAGLTFNADGSYTFDASSYDYLNDGESLVLTIPFTATDVNGAAADTANLVITVTGTNDTPVAQAAVAAVAEDATITGSVSATDADTGETATLSYALVGTAPAGLSFNADGSYSFDASSYDYLNDGEPLELTIPFTATDENAAVSDAANLVITVTGTNDTPVAQAAVAAVVEDAVVTGSVGATDDDAGETATLIYSLVNATPVGLSFNADGSYTFDASSYDYLNDGEPLVLTVPFTATDENGAVSDAANLVITVTGTNDVPVAQAAVAAVAEDASISGNVAATDDDAGETATLTYALVDPAPVGLSFSADGSYTFDASSYDYLNEGEPLVLTIPFTASDALSTSAPANLVITVTGTNDTPVAQAAVAAVTEDANISGSVAATDADANETATLTYSFLDPAPIGLSFSADGSYTFDASSYDYLVEGEPLVLTIPFTASDALSTSAPANLVITVTGTNDTPVAQAAVAAVAEDAMIIGNVVATDADANETATLTYSLVNAAPAGLTFNADGSYSFDASGYDALNDGEPLVLTVPYTATDEHGATSAAANLVITVTGANDPPVITSNGGDAMTNVNVAENTTAVTTVTATDADTAAMLTFGIAGGADAARFVIDPLTGVLSFVAAPNFEAPTDSNADNVYDVIVQASDGLTTDTQAIVVQVTDVAENVAPTVANQSFTLREHLINTTLSGFVDDTPQQVVGNDANGDALAYTLLSDNSGGAFTLSTTGALTVRDVSLLDFEGAPGSDAGGRFYTLTVSASDGQATSGAATVKVYVTNVAPPPIDNQANYVDGDQNGNTFALQQGADAAFGDGGNDTLTGDQGNDLLFGGAGNDSLDGSAGNDILYGGAGNDTLTGGNGNDTFVFGAPLGAGNVDVVIDFVAGNDKILLVNDLAGLFDGLQEGSGTLNATAFDLAGGSIDGDTRIVYDSATGALYYDEDGSGAAAAVQFATLSTGLALTNAHFLVGPPPGP